MTLACANAVLAVHRNYFVGSCMYELYALIQNWLLALYEHVIQVCWLGTSQILSH